MADEGYIGLPADQAGKKVRALSMPETQPDGTSATVYEQVLVLADPDGELVYVRGNALGTHDDRVAELLEMVVRGQARMLGDAARGRPSRRPDREAEKFINEVLGGAVG
jgi:hypothetical protein